MRRLVYSAIYGGKDKLREVEVMSKDVDYIMFTDDVNMKSKTWRLVYHPIGFCSDPRIMSRIFKMRPHIFFPNFRRSLWVDGNWKIIGDVNELFDNMSDKLYATMPPTQEPSIGFDKFDLYDEARHCSMWGKDDPALLKRQADAYHAAGHPDKFGLWRLSILIRSHNHVKMKELGDFWWQEYLRWSCRDQVSFPYVVWKMGLEAPFTMQPENYQLIFQKYSHIK